MRYMTQYNGGVKVCQQKWKLVNMRAHKIKKIYKLFFDFGHEKKIQIFLCVEQKKEKRFKFLGKNCGIV